MTVELSERSVEFRITKHDALNPVEERGRGVLGEPGGDLLSHTSCALSSARLRFTVLFGMGRGGSEGLWPPSITCLFAGEANAKREKVSCNCRY